jgi:hypothetical protein
MSAFIMRVRINEDDACCRVLKMIARQGGRPKDQVQRGYLSIFPTRLIIFPRLGREGRLTRTRAAINLGG